MKPNLFNRILLLAAACAVFNTWSKAQSTANNYIITYTPRSPVTNASTLPGSAVGNVNQTVQYFDGLGRPQQIVQTKASPGQRDMVQPMGYDQYGREAVKYLPYAVAVSAPDDGSYNPNAIADQASFYANPTNATWNAPGVVQTGFANSTTVFEATPLSRVTEQGFAGDNWQPAGTTGAVNPGHTIKMLYQTNNASGLNTGSGYWAKQYGVVYSYVAGSYNFTNKLADNGAYPYGTLYITVTENENWLASQTNPKLNTTEEYKDKFGQIVLKRTYNYNYATRATETLSTYYVYDDYGHLTYVLPPGVNPDNGGITQTQLDNLCYQYRYDGRGRIVEKKIPEQGWELMIYNQLNQVIATQDSVQRMKTPQQLFYTKYDAQGRVIITGYYQSAYNVVGVDNRLALQAAADAQTTLWETKSSTGVYSNVTIPTTGATQLTVNYYDDYKASGLPAGYTLTAGVSNMTRGLPTATQTAVVNTTADKLWSVQYYDDLGRVTTAYKQHYFGGHSSYSTGNYDLVTNTYNFSNQLTATTRQHFNLSATTAKVAIANNYDYDQVGRKMHTYQQITGHNGLAQTSVTLSALAYNVIGQLRSKSFHEPAGGGSFLYETVYTYNERGWLTLLTPSGNSYYGEQIYYNSPTGTATPQYNGNISQFSYNGYYMNSVNGFALTHFNTVNYTYDNLNRLTQSQSGIGKNDERVVYDVMGNIDTLVRSGTSWLSGTLSYTYNSTSNRLHAVKINGGAVNYKTYNYSRDGAATTDSTGRSLTYNMFNMPLVLTNSGVTAATYYYDANSDKLRDVSATAGTRDYIDGIVYVNGQIS